MKTIFIDIDGTIFRHHGMGLTGQIKTDPELLSGVSEKFKEWDEKGYRIVLVTGRKESMRQETENQLRVFGIFYDHLVMGLPRGERVVINDAKVASCNSTARGITIQRNVGLDDVDV